MFRLTIRGLANWYSENYRPVSYRTIQRWMSNGTIPQQLIYRDPMSNRPYFIEPIIAEFFELLENEINGE